ncbi:MAG: hypothetical protein ACOC1I_03125 [Spirochaetota bacterium]
MRRTLVLAFAVILALAVAHSALAQEPVDERVNATLFRETLVQDISTASFYELIGWLETLGLSTRGDRAALLERLYDFYDVTEDEIGAYGTQPVADEEEPPLVVDSASRTRYFTLEEIDERYIRLSGGVVLTLRADDDDAVHRIEADEIVFNQEHNTLSASGSVVYILERGETTERFTGEALAVELDTWEGAFVRGVTERGRTIEGREIDFSFEGTYITRSRDDVIVLEDGSITSSEADPPNYHIRARKIWILAPGEWGLTNAFLYVGRVPVFYFPFFFKPGNELFFNPSIGTRSRVGNYIQTTTYLVGTPEEETSPFSLLQLADEPGPQSEREIEGLYLVPREAPASEEEEEETDDTVRILADIYTKLGGYTALDASLSELGPLREVEFYLGLAASRHVYALEEGALYRPFYVTPEGEAIQSWNTTRIGSLEIPFRFGLDFRSSMELDRFSASADLEYYSDKRFRTDFEERSEDIDWLGFLGQGSPTTPPGPITSLTWQLSAQYTPDTSSIPLVSQLSLRQALVSLTWRDRDINSGLLSPEITSADASPERSFFYPDSLKAPDLSGSVRGTIFRFPGDDDRTIEEPPEGLEPIIPPWELAEPDPDDATSEPATDAVLTIPSIPPALPSPQLPVPFRTEIGYSLSPMLTVNGEFLDDEWDEPSDVDFDLAYGGASARLSGSLTYGAGFAADAVTLRGETRSVTQYRDVFARNPDLGDDAWSSLELQAWRFTSFSASNEMTLAMRPLRDVELWSESSISYTNDLLLYRVAFDSLVADEPTWKRDAFEWNEDYVTRHQVNAIAQLALRESQSLQVTATLPPRDEAYTGTMTLRMSPLSLTLKSGVRRPDEEFVYDPLTATAGLAPWESVRLSNTTSYSIEDEELTSSVTNLTAGPLSAQFDARVSDRYVFAGAGSGWEPQDDEAFRPYRASVGFSVDSDFEPMWRNRVIADVGADLSWQSSLTRFTQGELRFAFSGSLLIHRFLRLTLRTVSTNGQSYVYVPALAREVGREPRNVLVDLARSFNFFNREDRLESGFNLQSIELNALHDLGDWDLTVGYRGSPELVEDEGGTRSYEWRSSLDIKLQWRPISELTSSIGVNEDGLRIGDDP